jgi:HAMP domain-containing protein|tara:strand:+ start:340 stop:489 length:150 start_codon:yes stop_codon:yes gene_type:complete
MNKYFNVLFWSMLVVAGALSFVATTQLENRLDKMESQIDQMNLMLKEMQ